MLGRPTGLRLLLAVIATSAIPALGYETAPLTEVTLVWMDPEELLRVGFRAMADEVENAFDQAGVAVTWRKDFVSGEDDPLDGTGFSMNDADADGTTIAGHFPRGVTSPLGVI